MRFYCTLGELRAIANDLVGVVCQPSQMASCFIRGRDRVNVVCPLFPGELIEVVLFVVDFDGGHFGVPIIENPAPL